MTLWEKELPILHPRQEQFISLITLTRRWERLKRGYKIDNAAGPDNFSQDHDPPYHATNFPFPTLSPDPCQAQASSKHRMSQTRTGMVQTTNTMTIDHEIPVYLWNQLLYIHKKTIMNFIWRRNILLSAQAY